MTRTMYDSVNVNDIPLATDLAAVYFNGKYACTDQQFEARFGSLTKRVLIDVNGREPACDVLDVENGDATPETAALWVDDKNAMGQTGTVYCARDSIEAVWAACKGHSYYLWVATLDGTLTWNGALLQDVAGVVAVQFEGSLQTGINADRSVVFDASWPKVAAASPPVAAKWYGLVLTTDPEWVVPANTVLKKVTSSDKGKTWS